MSANQTAVMKNITTNKLQSDISKVLREVESGAVYQVSRYAEPIAYVISKKEFEKLVSGKECKQCVEDLRKIAGQLKAEERD